jgi:hypothetical protein
LPDWERVQLENRRWPKPVERHGLHYRACVWHATLF